MMEKINLALVNYPYVSNIVKYPIGLLNLKRILENGKNNIKAKIIDYNRMINSGSLSTKDFKNKNYQVIAKHILEMKPDIIGFSTIATSLDIVLELAAYIKSNHPNIIIFFGGPSASVSYDKILRNFTCVDFILLGESESCIEDVILSAIKNKPFTSICANIAFFHEGTIYIKKDAPYVELDKLPYLDLADYEGINEIDLEIGRGCPFNCYFCATSIFWHRKYEVKTPQRLIDEIKYYISCYGVSSFNFIHDLFTFDREYVLCVCKRILDEGINISWACSARIDCLDEELVSHMKNAGCTHIFVGIETGSQRMQNIIRKKLNVSTIKNTFDWLSIYGIEMTVSFVFGFPEERELDFIETLKLIQSITENFNHKTVLTKCTFYPNTDVYLKYSEKINTFTPTGDYLSLHWNNPSKLILENKDLFPCFFSYDQMKNYPYMDVFINFYIRIIYEALPNVYDCMTKKYDYLGIYDLLFNFCQRIDMYTRLLYEKSLCTSSYYKMFFEVLESEFQSERFIESNILDAFQFDIFFITGKKE